MTAWMIFLLIPIAATALWYVGSLAAISEKIRQEIADHLPRLSAFLQCPACSGTWYGVALGLLGDPLDDPARSAIGLGLCCMVTTPVLGALMLRCLDVVGAVFVPSQDVDP